MNHSSQHLSETQLADLAVNRPADAESSAPLAHAARCERCGAQLARLEQLIELMRTDTAEDAPRAAIAGVLGLFRPRAAEREQASLVSRILAALSFDSLQTAPAFGLRSAGTAAHAARHLLFTAGERDISLHISPGGETWTIAGQLLGEGLSCAGGEAVLEGERGTTRASLNDLCEFTLPPVASGRYTLRLRLGDTEIEVPTLDL